MRRLCLSVLVATCAAAAGAQEELSLDAKLTLQFHQTPLRLALDAVQDAAHANLVLAPGVDPDAPVDAEAANEPAAVLLDRIQSALGLARTRWAGAWVLHPKDQAPGPEPKKPEGEGAERLAQRVRSVRFQEAPLSEVISTLKAKTKQDFASLSFAVRKHLKTRGARVTLRLWNARLRDILHHVARACGLEWTLAKGKVVFRASKSLNASASGSDVGIDYDVLRGDTLKKAADVDVDRLVRMLRRSTERQAAVRLLVREGKTVCAKVAALLSDDTDTATKLAALEVLEAIGDPTEYAAVLKVFKNPENSLELRMAAGLCLGAMGAPEAVPDLIEALNDPWFRISETARKALVRIGKPAVAPLIKRFEAEMAKSRERANGIVYRGLLILGEIGTRECKKTLLRALRDARGSRDKDIAVRHHAAIGLGLANDVRLVEPLIAALKRERDFRVAKYIARSLTWITDHTESGTDGDRWQVWWELEGRKQLLAKRSAQDVLDDIAGGAVDLPVDERGYARLETSAQRLERLARELGDEERPKRRAAWRELEAMGEAALPTLRKVLVTGNPRARANAKAIIARIEGRAGEDE
ncbi:MAG: HEAT repeat domain-containing protein [Planctomycetota bacterium]|nr:MAG: HEAT repeat domain-containing protein [Planctomycetota bacterium]